MLVLNLSIAPQNLHFQLIDADIFSSKICQLCNNDLEVFHNFRKDLVQKQKKLYSAVIHPSNQDHFLLKTEEVHEFIECSGSTEDEVIEDYEKSEFRIKVEIDDHLGDVANDQLENDEDIRNKFLCDRFVVCINY